VNARPSYSDSGIEFFVIVDQVLAGQCGMVPLIDLTKKHDLRGSHDRGNVLVVKHRA